MRGIDVSSNNGPVDWRKVARAGITFAWVKATEGLTYVDPTLEANRTAARRAGIHVGVYHFARPDLHPTDAVGEAAHFARQAGRLAAGDLLPVLDLERELHGGTPAALESWARTFNHELESRLGRFPLFYSYPALIAGLHPSRPIGSGLWLASYARNDGHEHPASVPKPWKRVLVHQYTSAGRIDGINGPVDLNETTSLRPILAHPVRATIAAPVRATRRAASRILG